MGKTGIPMTVVMQSTEMTPNAGQPMGGPDGNYTGSWGSLYYVNGKATMTTSAFNASNGIVEQN